MPETCRGVKFCRIYIRIVYQVGTNKGITPGSFHSVHYVMTPKKARGPVRLCFENNGPFFRICYAIFLLTVNHWARFHLSIYDIYLLTEIGLTPGGSSRVHIYTQTIHRTTQSTQIIHRTQLTLSIPN